MVGIFCLFKISGGFKFGRCSQFFGGFYRASGLFGLVCQEEITEVVYCQVK